MVEVLKVSSHSNPNAVAGALAGVVRSSGVVEIQVVGAGALNQAVKAVAIARGYLTPSGVDLVCVPTFADIQIEGERRTAIRLLCENRAVAGPTVDLRTVEVSRAQERPVEADLVRHSGRAPRSVRTDEPAPAGRPLSAPRTDEPSGARPSIDAAGSNPRPDGADRADRAGRADPGGEGDSQQPDDSIASPAESPAQSL